MQVRPLRALKLLSCRSMHLFVSPWPCVMDIGVPEFAVRRGLSERRDPVVDSLSPT